METAKPAKPLKDVNSIHQAMVLNNFCKVFALLGAAGFMLGGLVWLLIALFVSIGVALTATGAAGLISNAAVNVFYGIRNGHWPLRERLAGDLSCVRVHKMNERFDDALITVESILAKDPGFPEALLLKAQILWEGHGDGAGARQWAVKAANAEPDKSLPLHRWARALYRQTRAIPIES